MSCAHVREQLGGYVLGALEPAERDAVAAHTGLPLGTVKSRTWYALRSLRLVLEEMGVVPQ